MAKRQETSYPEFYRRISAPFRQRPGAVRALALADKLLVALTAASFVGVAIWLFAHSDARLLRYLAVCGVSFVALTLLRAGLNKPRPYQVYDIDPLVHKDSLGNSFPSRHLFSIAIISCAYFWLDPVLGVAGFAATALLAPIRVLAGVHFPNDVAAGIILGVICGLVGFWII